MNSLLASSSKKLVGLGTGQPLRRYDMGSRGLGISEGQSVTSGEFHSKYTERALTSSYPQLRR